MHYSNTTELSLSQGKYKHKQNVNCLYSTELWSVQGRERALSQGVTRAPQEGLTWSTCSNWIFLNFKFSCQSTGTLGLQLQPCSRAWSSHCQWPAGCPECSGTGDPGLGLPRVRSGLTPTLSQQQPAGHQRTEQQVERGWSSPGWEQSSQGWNDMESARTGQEQRKENVRKKKANASSSCWRERCSDSKALNN